MLLPTLEKIEGSCVIDGELWKSDGGNGYAFSGHVAGAKAKLAARNADHVRG
ncbi:MAG TPA: hypothetical protein VEI98_00435 [Xanthobacteraceae bacterium]|nr:hypothetical protein [Xanthobacteraceae bacterium]